MENRIDITVDGDPVIQIGSVFTSFMLKSPYKGHIVVYKEGVEHKICDSLMILILKYRCKTEENYL